MSPRAAPNGDRGPPVIRVTSVDDPRLDVYRNLRDRTLASERASFIAEGLRVVERLARSRRFRMRSVLVSERRLERVRALDLPSSVPLLVLPDRRIEEVVGFDLHRGVLSAGERGSPLEAEAVLPPPGPAVVLGLVGLANHDNVGACFRHAAGFGASAVVLDRRCADPLYRKALRVGMGHPLSVPFGWAQDAEALLAALRRGGFETAALTPSSAAESLERWADRSVAAPDRLALLVGAEGAGLSPEVLDAADRRVRIPMAGETDSLNVATAAAVALFAWRCGQGEGATGRFGSPSSG